MIVGTTLQIPIDVLRAWLWPARSSRPEEPQRRNQQQWREIIATTLYNRRGAVGDPVYTAYVASHDQILDRILAVARFFPRDIKDDEAIDQLENMHLREEFSVAEDVCDGSEAAL